MWERTPSAPRGKDRLAVRRRQRRRRMLVASGILFLLLLIACGYALNQDGMRIKTVEVIGVEALGSTNSTNATQALVAMVTSATQGSYLGVIPRDSTIFYPGSLIRATILAAYPDVAAVSFSRIGLTGLSVRVNTRVPIARWCGAAPAPRFDLATTSSRSNLGGEDCYVFDAGGVLYATSTLIEPMNTFQFYEPFPDGDAPAIGVTLPRVRALPSAFDFARELAAFGSPVVSVVFRESEVDDYLASGTRVTYVLGNEQNAYTALVSARANLNLADGSIDYVDLRFDGKVYLKRKDAKVE